MFTSPFWPSFMSKEYDNPSMKRRKRDTNADDDPEQASVPSAFRPDDSRATLAHARDSLLPQNPVSPRHRTGHDNNLPLLRPAMKRRRLDSNNVTASGPREHEIPQLATATFQDTWVGLQDSKKELDLAARAADFIDQALLGLKKEGREKFGLDIQDDTTPIDNMIKDYQGERMQLEFVRLMYRQMVDDLQDASIDLKAKLFQDVYWENVEQRAKDAEEDRRVQISSLEAYREKIKATMDEKGKADDKALQAGRAYEEARRHLELLTSVCHKVLDAPDISHVVSWAMTGEQDATDME
jgi:hypothetical protein